MSKKDVCSRELEQSYEEALIDLLRPSGDVLEIGFGKGHSAARIQSYQPKSHLIIESDPLVAEQATKWSRNHTNVSLMQGTWQTLLPQLGTFNVIVMGHYLLESTTAQNVSDKESLYARALLQKEKELYDSVEKQIPALSNIRYSDHDIEEFLQNIPPSQVHEASYFIAKLKQDGQITEKQYEQIINKYQITKEVIQDKSNHAKPLNPTFVFLTECLKGSMRKGTRFACFLNGGISNFEDPQFFEQIITNPHLDYQEKSISLYRNNLKNRVFDKKAPRNSCLERETIVREQGSSEDKNYEVKPTPSETDSSGCFGISYRDNHEPLAMFVEKLA